MSNLFIGNNFLCGYPVENGTPIDLKKRCDGKSYPDNKKDNVPPYRYWFWIRANKKASTSITWRTDSYIATGRPISEDTYNAKEYVNSDKVTSVAINHSS